MPDNKQHYEYENKDECNEQLSAGDVSARLGKEGAGAHEGYGKKEKRTAARIVDALIASFENGLR